ncbi:MAG: hypothetical protein V4721_17395 [Bacteroidota bacterium]
MKKASLSIASIFLFVLVCLAADLTGTYKGSVSFQDNRIELTYKLKAEGQNLTGSITSEYGELPLLEGKIAGNDFTYKIDIGNGPMESKGKFMGDSIVVTSNFGGTEVKNTFKRVAE